MRSNPSRRHIRSLEVRFTEHGGLGILQLQNRNFGEWVAHIFGATGIRLGAVPVIAVIRIVVRIAGGDAGSGVDGSPIHVRVDDDFAIIGDIHFGGGAFDGKGGGLGELGGRPGVEYEEALSVEQVEVFPIGFDDIGLVDPVDLCIGPGVFFCGLLLTSIVGGASSAGTLGVTGFGSTHIIVRSRMGPASAVPHRDFGIDTSVHFGEGIRFDPAFQVIAVLGFGQRSTGNAERFGPVIFGVGATGGKQAERREGQKTDVELTIHEITSGG